MRPLLLVLFAASMSAQESRPAYEAASIKLNNSADGHSGTDGYQGRIMFENMPLHRLIAAAYGVSPFQVSGPDWLQTERFDIVATYPPGTKREDRPLMLRTLLEDRFKLGVHRESKEMAGYTLVVAKSGFKLKPSDSTGESDDTSHHGRIETVDAKKTSMTTLAALLARYLAQPVADKTGIEGQYDFSLRWSRGDQNAEPSSDAPPSIFTALQETLGLRLQAAKVPAEIVVVDSAQRMPTEN